MGDTRGGRMRICKRCRFSTSDSKEFLQHQMNAHTAEATEIHCCDECQYRSHSYTELQKHRKTHGRVKRRPSEDSNQGLSKLKESASSVKESVLSVKESAPGVKESTSSVKESASSVKESALSVKESTSSVKESTSSVKDSASSVKDSASNVKESALSVKESALSVKESTLSVKESASSVEDSTSSVKESEPSVKESALKESALAKMENSTAKLLEGQPGHSASSKSDDIDHMEAPLNAEVPDSDQALTEGEEDAVTPRANINMVFPHRKYICSDCGWTSTNARMFLRHQVGSHKYDIVIYECDLCDYATRYKQKLPRHRKCHFAASTASTPNSSPRASTPVNVGGRPPSPPVEVPPVEVSTGRDTTPLSLTAQENKTVSILLSRPSLGEKPYRVSDGSSLTEDDNNNNEPKDENANKKMSPAFTSALQLMAIPQPQLDDSHEDEERSLVIDIPEMENIRSPKLENTSMSMHTNTIMSPHTNTIMSPHTNTIMSTPSTINTPPKSKPHIREAVDPAKYVKVHDTEGLKYACSKCGNLYKWRKSLNKHWKEKHDGEVPVPHQGSLTMLNIPKYSTKLMVKEQLDGEPEGPMPAFPSTMGHQAKQFVGTSVPNDPAHHSNGHVRSFSDGNKPFVVMQSNRQQDRRSVQFGEYNSNALPGHKVALMASPNKASFPKPVGQKYESSGPPEAHTNISYRRPSLQHPAEAEPMDLSGSLKLQTHSPAHREGAAPGILDLSRKAPIRYFKGEPADGLHSLGLPQDEPLDFSKNSTSPAKGGNGSKLPPGTRDHHSAAIQRKTDPSLQCRMCAFVAKNPTDYAQHQTLHGRRRHERCVECHLEFNSIDELNKHFGNEHLESLERHSPPGGTVADGSSQKSLQLYKYLTQAQEQSQSMCMVCGTNFTVQADLVRHFNRMHPTLPNVYSKRPLEGGSSDEPAAKRSRVSMGENLNCSKCQFVAQNQSQLTRHNLVHSLEKTFYCNSCTFNTKSKDEFILHMRAAHKINIDSVIANLYGKSSIRPEESIEGDPGRLVFDSDGVPVSVQGARQKWDGSDSPPLTSPEGDDGSVTSDGTTIVIPQAPEGEAMDKQDPPSGRAPQGFRTPDMANKSASSAEMLLPYKCSVCEYRARWPSEITQHMKNHSDEKPFHCPRCSYKSKWKWDVVKHLKRCGGGTVKDVIDTTKINHRNSDSWVRPLKFPSGSPSKSSGGGILSNGPPNVTVIPLRPISPDESSSSTERKSTPSVEPQSHSGTDVSGGGDPTPSQTAAYAASMKMPEGFTPEESDISMDGSVESSTEPTALTDDMAAFKKHSRKPAFTQAAKSQDQFYFCVQCPFIGNSPLELKRHSRVHVDEKPFICRTCGYSTKWKCDLKKHVRTYDHVPAPEPFEDRRKKKKVPTATLR